MNKTNKDDISEEEIRIVGSTAAAGRGHRRWWLLIGLACVVLVAVLIVRRCRGEGDDATGGDSDSLEVKYLAADTLVELWDTLPTAQDSLPAAADTLPPAAEAIRSYCTLRDTSVNDVPLRIITPHGAQPRLHVGRLDTTGVILATMAADIRSDNKQIVGSYVLHGQLLSKGQAKAGYCAIVDADVTLGMDDSAPWLEKAIEREGDFFRQYALVHRGTMIDNKPKGKYIRRALCQQDGVTFIACSQNAESLHDFAQALADLPVDEAITLVGGMAQGYALLEQGIPMKWGGQWSVRNMNFIQWMRPAPEPTAPVR